MEKFDTRVDNWLRELDRMISQLHVSWTGEAAAAQQQSHQEWIAGARKMREALEELRTAGRSAHKNYGSAIDANVKMWGQG